VGGCSVNEKSWVGNGWVHRDLRKPWVLVGTRINCNQATPLVMSIFLRFPRTGDVYLSIDTVPDG